MALPAMTRGELATLGIHIDARGAITTTKALAGELDALGRKGAAVAGVAGGSVAPAIDKVAGATGRARLGAGRLGNQFGSLVASMSGVHPVAMNVVGVLGNFAIGGAVMAGILGGLAAMTFAYKKLTEDAREAAKATRELIADLREWATLQGGGADPMQTTLGITKSRESYLLGQVRSPQFAALPQHFQDDLRTKLAQAIKDRTAAEDRLHQRENADRLDRNTHTAFMAGQVPKRGRGGFDVPNVAGMIDFQMDRVLARGPNPQEWLDKRVQGAATAPFQMKPMAPMQSGLELKALSGVPVKLDSIGTRLADGLKGVSGELLSGLTNIAMQMAFLGGKGKGSQIGGWAGGTMGAGIGMAFGGPIGAAAGSIIGTMAGSLFGGLFDKKKKVASGLDMMATQLARVNQQLRNVPSGYRVNQMQYDATVPNSPPPTTPGWPGGGTGPGVPRIPDGGGPGGAAFAIYGPITVMANNTATMLRELERAAMSSATRGGVGGLALVGG